MTIDVASQLGGLAAMGARFGYGKGKRPMGRDWQRRPYELPGALRRLARGFNIGLVCGWRSNNLVVVDLDARAEQRMAEHALLAATRQIWREDAPDRRKFIFQVADRTPGSLKEHDAGVELISSGGYAVLAGVHPSGASYQMSADPVRRVRFAELDDLVFALTGRHVEATGKSDNLSPLEGNTAGDLLMAAVATAKPGCRNRTGFELARQLRDLGVGESQAAGVLLTYQAAVGRSGDHPYSQAEAMDTLKGVFRRPARRSHVDVVLDGLEAAIIGAPLVGPSLELPANVRKTAVAVIDIMRASGKIDRVGLSLRELAQRTAIPRSTIANHLTDLVDRFDVLVMTRRGNFSRASEYSLSDRAQRFAKVGHPLQGVQTPAGGVQLWHEDGDALLQQAIDTYRMLQPHPLTAPGARMHPKLAEDDTQVDWTFGAGVQALLAALAAARYGDVAALAAAVKLSTRTVYRRLAALLAAGLVVDSDLGYMLADDWLERANELAPALTTFGRLELRAHASAKVAALLHGRMTRQRNGEDRRIAEQSADRAGREAVFWGDQVGERQRERRAFGLALGLEVEAIPPISLTVGEREKRVQQPYKPAKAGRKVIPEGAVHAGRNRQSKREQLAALLRKGLLLADDLTLARRLAADLGVTVETATIQLS